jgi:hypothetical protein
LATGRQRTGTSCLGSIELAVDLIAKICPQNAPVKVLAV